jgi:hypothetical protein
MRNILAWIAFVVFVEMAAVAADTPSSAGAKWTVHEWGTFTSLQDESGNAIGGINTDDEPVPKFVHRYADFLLLTPTQQPATFFQGAPRCHPDVTMRLETPVLYFHPTEPQPNTQGVDVKATFRGGWLTEYFPAAEATAPGVEPGSWAGFGHLTGKTVSTLTWKDLKLGGDWAGPVTDEHVWTAPRAVEAASVLGPNMEAEKFLFYRGVAHIDAPIRVTQESGGSELVLTSQWSPAGEDKPLQIRSLWLVDIREDGKIAFRPVPSLALGGGVPQVVKTPGTFTSGDFNADNLAKLKATLHDALVAEGLFNDEANALLNTWELSYFKSAGTRLFFIVPRSWTDSYLPLEVSVPSDITRVMVGRIELVTANERNILRQIGLIPADVIINEAMQLHTDFLTEIARNGNALAAVEAGRISLATFGVAAPESYKLYLRLGRFRNALMLDEEQKCPTQGLSEMISTYRLEAYVPKEMVGELHASAAGL